MNDLKFSALLVRLPKGQSSSLKSSLNFALDSSAEKFDLEPLFTTTDSKDNFGISKKDKVWEWHLARPKSGLQAQHPWDLAHSILTQNPSLTSPSEIFVEPDLEQQWLPDAVPGNAPLSAGFRACEFTDQKRNLPGVYSKFAWHLDDAHSQLKSARDLANQGKDIRIVHLDTGFDPDHRTLPRGLNKHLQKNFLHGQPPGDASDPAQSSLIGKAGHGTGTLSILAGGHHQFQGSPYPSGFDDDIGGVPEAEIIPVRVGNSVLQLYTSNIASGINYGAELCQNEKTRVHVMSMSMGGVASQAWADAVNKAYEAGILFVCAAGNNFSAGVFGVPTRFIVYPARFRRVIAACGVMANALPYYDLKFGTMQGNWGPESKMATALSAYTPNILWAKHGCSSLVDMDGQGTSCAAPQVAAAAALYLSKHKKDLFDLNRYPEPWMRVEAVRHALFSSASKSDDGGRSDKLGNGVLKASKALAVAPVQTHSLKKSPPDSATFSFLKVLSGLGAAPSSTFQMLALEATQLAHQWHRNDKPNPLESAISDPDLPLEAIPLKQQQAYLEALRDHPLISETLKKHLNQVLDQTTTSTATGQKRRSQSKASKTDAAPSMSPAAALQSQTTPFTVPKPTFRKLRGFALDPSLSTKLETVSISEITFHLPWEDLEPGPVGEYLEVVDYDPASKCFYEPVHLDAPKLLAQNGLPPSEGTPQFHQQMVYAVASLTIRNFERALGRRALWRPGPPTDDQHPKNDSHYVQRLRIYPHALREQNAYYSPGKVALLFGYFQASSDMPGQHMAGGMVFTCLSHDIIAHETAHALLDGMNRAFLSPSNPDVHAFHEAFSDLVALFQHFTFPEILRHQIAHTRGDIRNQETLLGKLAVQFGLGIGLRAALRDAIGRIVEDNWVPHKPSPQEYEEATEPHARGAILVAAVFDAFLSIYERRTADLLRLASNGTGILQPGAIHPDLVHRLAEEATKAAHHVLIMCVRALDYCPPVDITFGEYLRALITADFDLVANDDLDYRTAFIQAFRKRGLYPRDVRTLSLESLLWRNVEQETHQPSPQLQIALGHLRSYADEQTYTESREENFHRERATRLQIHQWMTQHFESSEMGKSDAAFLGLDPKSSFEVRSVRVAYRTGPDGGMVPQLLLQIIQNQTVPVDPTDPSGQSMRFEGGSTVIADLRTRTIRFCIRKNSQSHGRLKRQQEYTSIQITSPRAIYFGQSDGSSNGVEPFAAIHQGY